METIFKSFVGVFFLLLLTTLGISLIASSIQANNADRALLAYVERIENSNYSEEVIDACKSDAADQFGNGREALKVVTEKQGGKKHISYGRATLSYSFKIPVIGFDTRHSVSSVMT